MTQSILNTTFKAEVLIRRKGSLQVKYPDLRSLQKSIFSVHENELFQWFRPLRTNNVFYINLKRILNGKATVVAFSW